MNHPTKYVSTGNLVGIAGFTLVELMISMTISIVLLGGVIETFMSSRQSYRLQESQARMQENARFIFAILSNSIRQTGYMGCNSRRRGNITNTLNNPDSFFYRFENALEGYEAVTNHWDPAIDSAIKSPVTGNDIIVIRGASDGGIRVIKPFMPTTSAALHVTKYNDLKQYDIVMVTDCISAAVMQITDANPHTSGTIAHNTGNGVPGNSISDLGKTYRDDAEIIKLVTRVFYIRTGAGGLPSLYQRIENNPSEELVQGVQGMQILYGEDIDGDATSDRFLSANQVDMDQVVSVKISILLLSITDALTSRPQAYSFDGVTVTPSDRRIRRVFTTTIALRNRIP